jgi:cytochrome bd-type quinol oxidase subunit 2
MPWASFLFSLGTFLLAVSVTIATKPIPENGDSEQMITNFWIFFIAALVFMIGAMFLGWRAEKNNNKKYERLITTMTEQHKTLIDAINNLGNWMWKSLKDKDKDLEEDRKKLADKEQDK